MPSTRERRGQGADGCSPLVGVVGGAPGRESERPMPAASGALPDGRAVPAGDARPTTTGEAHGRAALNRRPHDHRRPADRGAGGEQRRRRLVLHPALRLTERVRVPARRRPGRPLPDRSGGRRPPDQAGLPGRHGDPRHPVHGRGEHEFGDRLHAGLGPRGGPGPAHDRPGRAGRARADAVPDVVRAPLRLRPCLPCGGGDPCGGGVRVGWHPPRPPRRGTPRTGRRRRGGVVRGRGGPGRRFRLGDGRGRAPPRRAGRGARGARGHGRLLALVVGGLDLPGAVARDGQPVRHHPQAADLRPDWRTHRGGHRRPPRAVGRGAQLGLPLHLDPRLVVLGTGPARSRLHRGGRAARPLGRGPGARIRSRQRSRSAEDHVPGRRLPRPRRGDPRSLQRLQGIAPGPDRQRGRRPDTAGHLRRVRRLRLRGRSAGCAARQLRRLPDVRPGPELAVRELGPARRRHLGDTRRSTSRSRTDG